MGKNLKGKDCGKGICQRKDGLYYARFVNKAGKRYERYFQTLPEARNWIEDSKYATYFFFLWQLFYDNGNMFHYEGKTSGIKNLQIDSILAEYWCFPDEKLVEKFHSIAKSVQAKIDNNKSKSKELNNVGDFLLPLLMNGQAKVN